MGLFDVFKDLDIKDKVGDFWEMIDDPIKDVLEHTDRPRGFLAAALSGSNPIEGFQNPQEFQGEDTWLAQQYGKVPVVGGALQKAQGLTMDVLLDPVTYIPAANITKAKYLKPLAPILGPVAKGSVGKRIGAEIATNAGARIGAEAAGELAQDTPFETPAAIAGGILAGGLTASRVSGAKSAPKSGVLEEQLSPEYLEGAPNPFDTSPTIEEYYIGTSKSGLPAKFEDFENRFPTEEAAQAKYNEWVSKYSQFITDKEELNKFVDGMGFKVWADRKPNPNYYEPAKESPVNIEQPSTMEATFIRDAKVIPTRNAFEDEVLTKSHQEFAKSFATHQQDNPEVYKAYSNWIGSSAGEAGRTVREAFTNADERALTMHADGEPWREWARTQETPFIKGSEGLVFLYRGEGNNFESIYSSPSGLKFRTAAMGSKDADGNFIFGFSIDPKGVETPIISKDNKYFLNDTEIPHKELIDGMDNASSLPMFKYDQVVSSWTPAIKTGHIQGFLGQIIIDKPSWTSTGTGERVALGQWHPIDDVIGPVGGLSGEYEFLVMNRKQIPPENYRKIVGVEQFEDLETPQQLFKLTDTRTGQTLSYHKTQEEAELAASEVTPNPISADDEVRLKKYQDEIERNQKNLADLDAAKGSFADVDYDSYKTLFQSNIDDYQMRIDDLNLYKKGVEIEPVTRGGIKATKSITNLTLPQSEEIVPAARTLIPEEISNLNAGNELVEAAVGEPTTPLLDRGLMSPFKIPEDVPIAGGAGPNLYSNLITSRGINRDVAKQLSGLDPKTRTAISDMIVNQLGAKGADAEFIKLVGEGYVKAGVQDPSKIGRLNNALRGMWATGDGSWFGIQGLLTIPRLLAGGNVKDAMDVLALPMFTLAGNKTAMTKYVRRSMEMRPAGAPTLREAQEAGLHLAFLEGNVDMNFTLMDKLPFFKPNDAFMAAGDISRISMFYNEWARFGVNGKGSVEDIARAVNRATGIAENPFGGQIGSFALFAPRFFQSQIEIVTKAFTDGSIEGMLARRQLLALVGSGVALTVAANYVRGEEMGEDFIDPRSPNFMRIKNVMGSDISVFGPWDSLARLVVHIGQGDLGYARTKFGPLASLATNIITGSTFINDPIEGNPLKIAAEVAKQGMEVAQGDFNLTDMDAATKNSIKSLFLPFAWQELGSESAPSSLMNFFGVKNSPLSRTEKIEANMANLGMNPDDPLDRRQFFADHPEYRSKAEESDIQANEYREDIGSRRKLNEDKTTSGEFKLVEFRENRKILNRELRAKLDALYFNRDDFKADTTQKKWVDSYFQMFDGAKDPVTGDINGEAFDLLESKWMQANGPEAMDYLNRYMMIDKGPIELQYLQDMQELDTLGYFDTQKYDESIYELTGGLTDEQIGDYRNRVSAARSANPELASLNFKTAMYEVLGDELTDDQIAGLDYAGKNAYANPAIEEMKAYQPHLFMWFNQNATWENYKGAKNEATEIPSTTLAIPSLSSFR